MNPFFHEIDKIEGELQPKARTAYARGRRFLNAYLPALVTTLAAAGPNLTLALILSTGLSVAVTILGEIDPAVPWSMITDVLDRRRSISQAPVLPPTKSSGT